MRVIKNLVKWIFLAPVRISRFFSEKYSELVSLFWRDFKSLYKDDLLEWNGALKESVDYRNEKGNLTSFTIYTPNSLCDYRVETFSTKEPETLEWIDNFGGKGPLYDIGANIGLYSLYYARTHSQNVYAFEPSFFNLKLLAKNINANNLSARIKVVANPLSDKISFADFNLSSNVEGGALSSFGVDFGHDGNKMAKDLNYQTLGFSLDYMIENKILEEVPSLVKIDVDGIEHIILNGAKKTLSSPDCHSVLIEVNDYFKEQSDGVKNILTSCGFSLKEKRHSEILDGGSFEKTFNQIWVKD